MKLSSQVSMDLVGNAPSELAKVIASNSQKAEEMKKLYDALFHDVYNKRLDIDPRSTPRP